MRDGKPLKVASTSPTQGQVSSDSSTTLRMKRANFLAGSGQLLLPQNLGSEGCRNGSASSSVSNVALM